MREQVGEGRQGARKINGRGMVWTLAVALLT